MTKEQQSHIDTIEELALTLKTKGVVQNIYSAEIEAILDGYLSQNGEKLEKEIKLYIAEIAKDRRTLTVDEREFNTKFKTIMESILVAFSFKGKDYLSEEEIDNNIDNEISKLEEDPEMSEAQKSEKREEYEKLRVVRKKFFKLNLCMNEKLADIIKPENFDKVSKMDTNILNHILILLAQNPNSFRHFFEFFEFEKKMKENNTPISPTIRDCFVQSAFKLRMQIDGGTYHISEKDNSALEQVEGYCLDYVSNRLDELDKKADEVRKHIVAFDGLWEDGIVNFVLQLKNSKRISRDGELSGKLTQLEKKLQKFVEKHFNEKVLNRSYQILDEELGENRENANYEEEKMFFVRNEKRLARVLSAYKAIYLYELLANKQGGKEATSSFDSNVLIFHALIAESICKRANIDPKLLLKRASQKIVAKESQAMSIKDDCPIVVEEFFAEEKDRFSDKITYGALVPHRGTIALFIEGVENYRGDAGGFFKTIYHELDHYDKLEKQKNHVCSSYFDYLVLKCKILTEANPYLKAINYKALQSEMIANCAGYCAKIRLGRLFQETGGLTRSAQKEIKGILYATQANWLKDDSKNVKSLTTLMDEVLISDAKNKLKESSEEIFLEVLDFEYNKDGTPKRYEQIIQDQQREIDEGTMDSETIKERTKLRMQIIMDRLYQNDKSENRDDERCFKLFKKFIADNYEVLKGDPVFDNLNDTEKVGEENKEFLEQRIEEKIKTGNVKEVEEAIFEHKLKHLMSKVLKREQIAGQVFETSKNVLGESRTGTTNPSEIAANPQNGGNDFSDGPDDQTQ